jgi:hypothetical protein
MFRQFKDLQKSDAREGMGIPGFWESMVEFYQRQDAKTDVAEVKNRAEKSLDRLRCFQYANCWNMSKSESALMWKAYAPQGIAITTTVGKFTHAKQESGQDLSVRSQKIAYANSWSELRKCGYSHNGIALNRLFLHTKRRAFAGEKEIRFRIAPVFKFGAMPDGSPDPNECPPWYPVIFENLAWIEEVVAESSIPKWAMRPIHELANQQSLTFRSSEI